MSSCLPPSHEGGSHHGSLSVIHPFSWEKTSWRTTSTNPGRGFISDDGAGPKVLKGPVCPAVFKAINKINMNNNIIYCYMIGIWPVFKFNVWAEYSAFIITWSSSADALLSWRCLCVKCIENKLLLKYVKNLFFFKRFSPWILPNKI